MSQKIEILNTETLSVEEFASELSAFVALAETRTKAPSDITTTTSITSNTDGEGEENETTTTTTSTAENVKRQNGAHLNPTILHRLKCLTESLN